MTPFGLVLAALAAWQTVEVWQHGSIFATARAKVQALPGEGFLGWLGELLACPFCQSVWVGTAAAAVVVADLPAGEAWYAWGWFVLLGVAKLCAYGLAVSRLSNLANDLTHGVSRTPNQEKNWLPGGDLPAAPVGPTPNNDIEDKTPDERPAAAPDNFFVHPQGGVARFGHPD